MPPSVDAVKARVLIVRYPPDGQAFPPVYFAMDGYWHCTDRGVPQWPGSAI
jgi:hypothetical protein